MLEDFYLSLIIIYLLFIIMQSWLSKTYQIYAKTKTYLKQNIKRKKHIKNVLQIIFPLTPEFQCSPEANSQQGKLKRALHFVLTFNFNLQFLLCVNLNTNVKTNYFVLVYQTDDFKPIQLPLNLMKTQSQPWIICQPLQPFHVALENSAKSNQFPSRFIDCRRYLWKINR